MTRGRGHLAGLPSQHPDASGSTTGHPAGSRSIQAWTGKNDQRSTTSPFTKVACKCCTLVGTGIMLPVNRHPLPSGFQKSTNVIATARVAA